jgi:hypothetical protein
MKLKTITYLALALLCSCDEKKHENSENSQLIQQPIAGSLQLTTTDYDIISQGLNHFFELYDSLGRVDTITNKRDYYKLLISGDSTIMYPKPKKVYADETFGLKDSTYRSENNRKYKIDCSKITSFRVHCETEQERKKTYGRGYEEFYELFPDAYGSISFTKPSYDENNERALIYIEFWKKVRWGRAAYVLFKFENGKWIYIRTNVDWVS